MFRNKLVKVKCQGYHGSTIFPCFHCSGTGFVILMYSPELGQPKPKYHLYPEKEDRSTTRAYRHKSIGQKLEEVMLPKGEA